MQDLSTFSDAAILETTEKLVKTERETTNQILHYLLENERRRIFAKEGFGSLFEYCVNRLGYSESGASRRIHSMRLLRSLGTEKAKEIEKKIESGKLSLSVVAQAATFILREAKNAPGKWDSSQKEALLSSLEGHSARETERKLLSLASEKTLQVQLEKLRPVSENLTELKVTLNSETLAALEKLKGLLSHKNPNLSWSELIEILADIALKKLDPAKEVRSRKSPEKFSEKSPKNSKENSENSLQTPTLKVTERNVVPATLERQIWQRDQCRCQYQDPKSGKFCHSQRFLEIEHRVPVSHGGQNSLSNLVLYCKYHNQLSAIAIMGHSHMEKWIPALR